MNKVQVLDCTLRDGGYCNEWQFGYNNIKKIIDGLIEANIDIVECGFLTNKVKYDPDVSKYTNLAEIEQIITGKAVKKHFVVMINYGEYDINDLPAYDGNAIDGIRVAFHKKDMTGALELCRRIKEKGYLVFVQAMVSLSYSDKEFLELIHQVNNFLPYAFYIVDSFGMMKKKELVRLFYMVEHNLNENVLIGFHSHNNMQLAYSNAQCLVDIQTSRKLIIDSSVYGMGRGAGNLNTELFVEYLNDNADTKYILKPLLTIIDGILNELYQENYWGYSLPNYLSASHNAHPNYATYLDDKKTLNVEDINEIFNLMDTDKRAVFDKEYIENLYFRYMAAGKTQEEHRDELKGILSGKKVLLIAPGKSILDEKEAVDKMIENPDIVTLSVNFEYPHADFAFLSNLRRFRELDVSAKEKCIVTSNIPLDEVYLRTDYRELLNNEETVRDNAGMMAIKFLILYGVDEIFLAGFDGYSHDDSENYASNQQTFVSKNAILDMMNEGMINVLRQYSKKARIEFLTAPKHIKL